MIQSKTAPETSARALPNVRFRGRGFGGDPLFRRGMLGIAVVPVLVLLGLVVLLTLEAYPAIARYGLGFLNTSVWDPVFEKFGAAAFIFGTIFTSLIAVLLATPIAMGAAIFLTDYAPDWLQNPLSFLIELLAAIPSIIYGLWGFFVLAPFMRENVEPILKATLSPLPVLRELVQGPVIGRDILTAGVILAIMIVPTIQAISREVMRAVPRSQREGMLALGATRWEMVLHAVLPTARPGIVAAVLLGLARALGETMAVTMVIGNSSRRIAASLFTPGYTIASAIANQFTEADKEIYFSAIVELALVLLLVSAALNIAARAVIARIHRLPGDVW